MKKEILITGGAGYIGSDIVKELLKNDSYSAIIIIDNLSTGFKKTIEALQTIDYLSKIQFYKKDLVDIDSIELVFKKHNIVEIIHLAAFSDVAQSVQNPIKYFHNNLISTINLCKLSLKYKIKKFLFSSTASVYGKSENENNLIDEATPTNPVNPYGSSKLCGEKIIQDSFLNTSTKYIILRYFNVSGSDDDYIIGELHSPETHLIPKIAQSILNDTNHTLCIYGDDYDTFDGTCIRDYIHIKDLTAIQIKALTYLDKHHSDIFNCGYAKGYSVKQIVKIMKKISKSDFSVKIDKRREGDVPVLVADNKKIISALNWTPLYNDLETICKSTLQWQKKVFKR